MSEIGELYAATREIRKVESARRKERNKQGSVKMLIDNNINFEEKNGGTHLVVKHNEYTADFWPTTGKFNIRGDKRYFRGVRLLIKIVRGDYIEQQFKSLRGE